MILSAALDLGTTRIKGALLDDRGELTRITSVSAPILKGTGLIRESSPSEYVKKAENVFHQLYRRVPRSIPVGISSQRSSFLLWEKETAKPVTPLISWQDRRALRWIEKRTGYQKKFTSNTGLPFSPHYAGPKLASILEEQPDLKKRVEKGLVLFGTIESYIIWLWSNGETHLTDITMASRTLLYNLNTLDWADDKLLLYGIPRNILPRVTTSGKIEINLQNGPKITALTADQPSAFYAASHNNTDNNTVVNLGTGGFVISLCHEKDFKREGVLYTPIYNGSNRAISMGIEGTVNGLTASLRKTKGSLANASRAFVPDAYCLPDSNGVGSPHWNPSLSLIFSKECSRLGDGDRRRVLFEGIVFRVAEIIETLNPDPEMISLCGGLSNNPFFKKGLATCLNQKVRLLGTPEGSLLGAALMAAGKSRPYLTKTSVVFPSKNASLAKKFKLWKEWMKSILET